jgi:hypothetical protein
MDSNTTQYEELMGIYKEMATSVTKDTDQMTDSTKRAFKGTEDAVKSVVKSIIDSQNEMANATVMTQQQFSESVSSMYSAVEFSQEQMASLYSNYLTEFEANVETQKQYMQDLESATSNHYRAMGGFYDEAAKANTTSAKTVEKNMKEQTKQFESWLGEIKALGEREEVTEGLMKELIDLGPTSERLIKDLNKKTPEQLEEFVDVWKAKTEAAKNAAEYELNGPEGIPMTVEETVNAISEELKDNSVVSDAEKLGKDMGDGLITGMNSKKSAVGNTAASMARKAIRSMRNEIQPGSPSKVTTRFGETMPEGLALGIKKKASKAIDEAKQLAFNSIEAMRLMENYGVGVSNIGGVVSRSVAQPGTPSAIQNAIKKVEMEVFGRLDINSPYGEDATYKMYSFFIERFREELMLQGAV